MIAPLNCLFVYAFFLFKEASCAYNSRRACKQKCRLNRCVAFARPRRFFSVCYKLCYCILLCYLLGCRRIAEIFIATVTVPIFDISVGVFRCRFCGNVFKSRMIFRVNIAVTSLTRNSFLSRLPYSRPKCISLCACRRCSLSKVRKYDRRSQLP